MKPDEHETIVFRIVDRKAFGEMMQHHMDGTPIRGLVSIIIVSGDCVTVPGEIVEEVASISLCEIGASCISDAIHKANEYLDNR